MATGQILKDNQFYGGVPTPKEEKLARVKAQNAERLPKAQPVVSDASFIGTPTKPIATTKNPVVSVNPKPVEASGFVPGQLANIDTMGIPDIQDYVDYLSVKGSKKALTETEQRELLKAQRKLQAQAQAVTATNPRESQISAEEQARQKREQELKQREQALISAEEQRLKAYYDQQAQKTQQAGQKQQEAAQSVLSFSGFGRSSVAAEQQAQIQQSINEAMTIQEAERNTALERYRAQQQGATAEELASYDQRISQYKQQSAQFVAQTLEQANAINQQTAQSYQEKIDNILALSATFAPATPLTEAELQQAKSYAQLAIDQDGNIDTDFLKTIPSNMMSEVIKEAALVKGARPGASKEFGFINAGQGIVAITDPTTGQVRYEKGPRSPDYEFKTAGDNAYAFNPITGETQQINVTGGTLEGIGSGKVTSYGTQANPFGLDVDGKIGDPIVSRVAGKVVEVGNDPGGYGNFVVVEDAQGNRVRYAHTDKVLAQKGQQIQAGQQIATVGNTGYTIPGPGGDGSHVDITLFGPDGKERGAKDVETYLKSAAPTKLSPEAMSVINGTMALKDVPAADRTRIAAEIQTSGQEIVKQSAVRMADEAIKRADEIVASPGFGGAVGFGLAKGGIFREKPVAGTKAYDTYNMIESLKAILTIPMLENMRGLGAMTEKEFETMKNAATTLNASMTEGEFKKEIQRIKETMVAVKARGGTMQTTQTTADPLGLR